MCHLLDWRTTCSFRFVRSCFRSCFLNFVLIDSVHVMMPGSWAMPGEGRASGTAPLGWCMLQYPSLRSIFWHPLDRHRLTPPCSQHRPLLTAHLPQPSCVHFKPPRPRRLPCLLQKPRPRSILVQLGTLQSFTPPCSMHSERVFADRVHPSTEQVCPPPCLMHKPRSLTGVVHPSTEHRLPPPWDLQKPKPASHFLQSGAWHSLPPPCAAQRPLKCPGFSQPSCVHRLPPPWDTQKDPRVAPLVQLGTWHRLPPPWATQNPRPASIFPHPSWVQRLPPPCSRQRSLEVAALASQSSSAQILTTTPPWSLHLLLERAGTSQPG
mmetsp:Transcript_10790/g.30133  ORF Transcript_10790/g.30133 Transcript_10790/m.30133 type:complete len:322 (-) Transcript_10790:931-1896(-)